MRGLRRVHERVEERLPGHVLLGGSVLRMKAAPTTATATHELTQERIPLLRPLCLFLIRASAICCPGAQHIEQLDRL